MVEQEQLSGMDLLMVQQHLLIICLMEYREPNQYNGAKKITLTLPPVVGIYSRVLE
jgi:hypothetical protein